MSDPSPPPPMPWWRAVLVLDVAAGTVLLVCMALFGLAEGFGSYLAELGGFTASLKSLAFYTGVVIIYAVGIEAFLRLFVQRQSKKRWGAKAGIVAAAGIYALLHMRHGLAGGAYGLLVGLSAAALFERIKDWRVMVLWHLQWDLLTIGVCCLWALALPGPPRDAINLSHKTRLVEAGRLQHHPNWGWVDAAHYWGAQRRFCAIRASLDADPPAAIELTAVFEQAGGARLQAPATVEWTAPMPPKDRNHTAAAAVMAVSIKDEQAQAEAPFFSGLRMSAWNFDDLPTVQRALLDALTHPDPQKLCEARKGPAPKGFGVPGATTPADLSQWKAEAPALIQQQSHGDALPNSATEAERQHFERMGSLKRFNLK